MKKIYLDIMRKKFEHGIKGKIIKSYGQEIKIHVKIAFLNRYRKIILKKRENTNFEIYFLALEWRV